MIIVEVIKNENGELVISDGRFEIACLLTPLKGSQRLKVGTKIKEIFAYSSSEIEFLLLENKEERKYLIQKGDKAFEYVLQGEILCKEKELIKVSGFLITVEGLPSWLKKRDFVRFKVDRLDCV